MQLMNEQLILDNREKQIIIHVMGEPAPDTVNPEELLQFLEKGIEQQRQTDIRLGGAKGCVAWIFGMFLESMKRDIEATLEQG